MNPLRDSTIWNEVRERAARIGWDDRERVTRETVSHIARRFKLDDEGRENLRGRVDRLWTERMTVWGC